MKLKPLAAALLTSSFATAASATPINAVVCATYTNNCWTEIVDTNLAAPFQCAVNGGVPVFAKTASYSNVYTYFGCDYS